MIQEEELIELYADQYRRESKRRANIRIQHYEKRINFLEGSLKRMRVSQVSRSILEDYHRQIKNLLHVAVRCKNWAVVNRIYDSILKELVRLDLAFIGVNEQSDLDEDFIDFILKEMPGAVCTHALFDLCQQYRRYSIENRMTKLVPSRPEMEFPKALKMSRHFILHVGPTNSGKTFQALKSLKAARHGIYLGPLRLLALEVYEKMREYGTPCTMLTGQECIEDADSRVTASTIEMLDITQKYDVAVIDEAQLVADVDRGHSWTRAILGIQAEEIHVCLSPAAESVVTHLIGLCGDYYDIHRYERKTALVCEDKPFKFPNHVRPGDALIVFSKRSVLDVAGRLEERGIKASVIYGSLPPEIRRRQVEMFASGQTKVVVATDAIGMGLNLPVRRIVFVQTEKFDGIARRMLSTPEIKQIAGRAGRFGIYDTGYVTAMGEDELEYIRKRYTAWEESIETVNLGFPQVLLELKEPLDAILKVWHSVETPAPFVKVSIDDTLYLYEQAKRHREKIYGFDNKYELYRMISCPIDIKDRWVVDLWLKYCETYAVDVSLPYPKLQHITVPGIVKYETYYKELDLYYQFSVRMGKRIDYEWLAAERRKTENRIMKFLLKGKTEYISLCRYCGRMLPVGYSYAVCEDCYRVEHQDYRRRK